MTGEPAVGVATNSDHRRSYFVRAGIVAYALALLLLHVDHPWRLVHEDNGAMQSSLALSHLRYGLSVTHGFNVFINPHSGAHVDYAHHPAGVPLAVAAAFAVSRYETRPRRRARSRSRSRSAASWS